MRGDKASTANIEPGRILQVNPGEGVPVGAGKLCVVVSKESWGVIGRIEGEGSVRLAWSHLGDTGGSIVWAPDGKKVKPEEPGVRHHE